MNRVQITFFVDKTHLEAIKSGHTALGLLMGSFSFQCSWLLTVASTALAIGKHILLHHSVSIQVSPRASLIKQRKVLHHLRPFITLPWSVDSKASRLGWSTSDCLHSKDSLILLQFSLIGVFTVQSVTPAVLVAVHWKRSKMSSCEKSRNLRR